MRRHAPQVVEVRRVRTLVASLTALIVGTALYAGNVRAQAPAPTLPSTGTIAVTTYESAGLYWQSPGGTAGCEVKYRKDGESAWKQGLAMWYDSRDAQCRDVRARTKHRDDRGRQVCRLHRPRRQPARGHHQHPENFSRLPSRRPGQPVKGVGDLFSVPCHVIWRNR